MKVLFISPHYPAEMQDFTRGLSEVGAQVYGVADVPAQAIPDHVRRMLSGHIHVPRLFDARAALGDVVRAVRHLGIDRVETNWEPMVLLAAELRAALDVPGLRPNEAKGFRDKATMKERIAAAGLRVPLNERVFTVRQAWEAAEKIGFPVVVKPISGAGSADTYRVASARELEDVLARLTHIPEVSVEEYVEGDEFTYDTVCIDGVPAFESVAQYHPKPIEARSQEWISPAQIVFRDPYRPETEQGIALGRGVLSALGMKSGFTHMEWYRKRNGEVVFGEIGCRAPGAKLVDQMNFANDFDVYREWARAVCFGQFATAPKRAYHVATVFKRAMGQGRIQRIEGWSEVRARCGSSIVAADLLPIGTPRRDWKATLLSDGHVIVRHPDYDTVVSMMKVLITQLRMYAG